MSSENVLSAGDASAGKKASLWGRNFLLLFQGQTMSSLGTQAFLIAQLF